MLGDEFNCYIAISSVTK